MSNPIHIQTALLSAMLSHRPPSPDRDTQPVAILVTALNRAVNDLENQGPRSERIALQLLEALARYEFEDHLERALKSDLDLAPYEETREETEDLPPAGEMDAAAVGILTANLRAGKGSAK